MLRTGINLIVTLLCLWFPVVVRFRMSEVKEQRVRLIGLSILTEKLFQTKCSSPRQNVFALRDRDWLV